VHKVLLILEFSSERKRQSIIVQEGNDIILYSKGADNFMIENMDPDKTEDEQGFVNQLQDFLD